MFRKSLVLFILVMSWAQSALAESDEQVELAKHIEELSHSSEEDLYNSFSPENRKRLLDQFGKPENRVVPRSWLEIDGCEITFFNEGEFAFSSLGDQRISSTPIDLGLLVLPNAENSVPNSGIVLIEPSALILFGPQIDLRDVDRNGFQSFSLQDFMNSPVAFLRIHYMDDPDMPFTLVRLLQHYKATYCSNIG